MALTINGTTGIETNTDTGKIKVGADDDLQISHTGSISDIVQTTNTEFQIRHSANNGIQIRTENAYPVLIRTGGEESARFEANGAVELYHDNVKTFNTCSTGMELRAGEGGDCELYMYADEGDDNADLWKFVTSPSVSQLAIQNKASGSWENSLIVEGNGAAKLYYDNVKVIETKSDGAMHRGPNSYVQTQYYTDTTYRGSVYANTSDYIGFLDHSGNWVIQAQRDTETEFHATNIVSDADDSYNVGSSSKRWDNIYATNGSIQTSDRNEKNTIVDSDLGLSFVNKLKPVSYKFNGKTRTHYGLIAQDVETTLSDISKTTTDFAGFIKSDTPEIKWRDKEALPEGKSVGDVRYAAGTRYGLRYAEFISPLVKAVQELSAEVETLKTKVAALEAA